jgi:hypothetical protein
MAQQAVAAMDDVLQWARADDERTRLRIGLSVFSPRFRAILVAAQREMAEIDWQITQIGLSDPYRPLLKGDVTVLAAGSESRSGAEGLINPAHSSRSWPCTRPTSTWSRSARRRSEPALPTSKG